MNVARGQFQHGETGSKAWTAWWNMLQRCLNPRNRFYRNYGGRGIRVCPQWVESFRNFLRDVGPGKSGWSIERLDNNGDYCIQNVVWALPTKQLRNKRDNVVCMLNGFTGCVSEIIEHFHIVADSRKRRMIYKRLKRGWDAERAFSQP